METLNDYTIEQALDALWEAYGNMPFASSTIQHKLNLSIDDYQGFLILLVDMHENGDVMFGYSVRRPTPNTYWLYRER